MAAPLKTFIIYSSRDRELRDEFLRHLQPLIRSGVLRVWSDNEIPPGEPWNAEIQEHLDDTDLFLPLVSVNFFNSDYIQSIEMPLAEKRRQSGRSFIIPVLLNDCSWQRFPVIRDLQMLPPGSIPVTYTEHWRTRDRAWTQVVDKIGDRADQIVADPDFISRREADIAAKKAAKLKILADQEAARQAEIQKQKQAKAATEQRAREEAERKAKEQERLQWEREAQQRREAEAAAKKKQEQERQRREQAEAERRRKEAEAERNRQLEATILTTWKAAEQKNTAAAYNAFVKQYPKHTLVNEARNRASKLRRLEKKAFLLSLTIVAVGTFLLWLVGMPSPFGLIDQIDSITEWVVFVVACAVLGLVLGALIVLIEDWILGFEKKYKNRT